MESTDPKEGIGVKGAGGVIWGLRYWAPALLISASVIIIIATKAAVILTIRFLFIFILNWFLKLIYRRLRPKQSE